MKDECRMKKPKRFVREFFIHHSAFCLSPGLWCNSSIFAREANGPGANPGFLTK